MRWLLIGVLLLAGCASPQKPPTAAVQPVWTPVRSVPTHASRSRPTELLLSVTCYLPTGHRTASGTWPRPGMAAGNRWPFGTRLQVQGVGPVVITDRIGHGSQLDLFMLDRENCRHFGRRRLYAKVVR